MPADYGPPGAKCSCLVVLEWQDPDPSGRPLNLGGDATMARYAGGGEGSYAAVIRMPRWRPGRYAAVLRINQREVDRKEFEVTPGS
jgi:hypothetical protein